MNKSNSFICPQCGNKILKTNTEPKTLNEFLGAVCIRCNYTITENDIRDQVAKYADSIMWDIGRKL